MLEKPSSVDLFYTSHIDDNLPVTCAQISMETRRDPTLSKVMDMTINGWSQDVSEELAPYTKLRNELSILQGCLMWGNRVIVPPKLVMVSLEIVLI